MNKIQKGCGILLLTATIASAVACGGGYGGSGNSVYHMPPTPAPTKTK